MISLNETDAYQIAKKKKLCIACKYWKSTTFIHGVCNCSPIRTRFDEACAIKNPYLKTFTVIDAVRFTKAFRKVIDNIYPKKRIERKG
jgi:hypothetical protein